ncbi:hypothetical protein CYMTET_29340 [Cymbomonas tetramitiformis]|uniref:PiggyBac transposable element-derived protein domain-containing protein n=1 Tax=Cymbomonas tetramitiformis TaxID=36881 RepID=A0AAE0KV92_9CHLO|nr:hypothetical protein CYMTET_29340 [Cymbomonas tetramitiformis]
MCFMFAAFGIPYAWEFYTGADSNTFNEELYNTVEEKAYGKHTSRILRLYKSIITAGNPRKRYEDLSIRTEGHSLYMDNLFVSIFLFYILWKVYKAGACGTHRENNKLPNLSWGATFQRGAYKWATTIFHNICFLYVEYGDNKIVRFLSTIHSSPENNPVDLADMLESFVRILFKTRRPYMVNYFWHFEMAVTSSHQFCKLLYGAEAYKRRSMRDDIRALVRCMLEYGGTMRELERVDGAQKRKRRSNQFLDAAKHPPTEYERGRCFYCRNDKKKTFRGCQTCEALLCSPECWTKYHDECA